MHGSDRSQVRRRSFLQGGLAAAGALCLPADSPRLAQAAMTDEKDASQVVAGKDKRLVVHESFPHVLETPPELLDSQLTPIDVLFVRNNQKLDGSATTKPLPLKGWQIGLTGAVSKAKSIAAEDLAKLPQVDLEMVLQCCGNGRSLFANTVKAKGTQWTRGGMGNLRVKGVRLSTVLEKLGVQVNDDAQFLTAAGKDSPLPNKEDFEHSLPLDDALKYSILALSFNGEPIAACHGGPVRLMTPGYYGTMHIKWLSQLRFEAKETDNYNQIPRYRTPVERLRPGKPIKYTFDNSKACWRMKLKSVVIAPSPDARVKAGQKLRVRGVAFNDGQARIEAVLLSVDQGKTWHRTRMESPESPYAWYRWSSGLTLPAGKHEIWTRAVDRLGRSQPLNGSVAWNPSGYEWNGIERISITAS